MRIVRGRPDESASIRRGDTFVGEVWSDPVLPPTDGVMINNIFLAPGARTNWHTHEHGQVLQVTAGAGWVCTKDETPQPLAAGDLVWVPPGETHWHGADTGSFMTHTAISLGVTSWAHEVSDEDYQAGRGGRHG